MKNQEKTDEKIAVSRNRGKNNARGYSEPAAPDRKSPELLEASRKFNINSCLPACR